MKLTAIVTVTSSITSVLVSLLLCNQPTLAVTLGSLLNGGKFSSGNLLFDQFTFTPASNGTSSPASADQINVSAISTSKGYGLEFLSDFSTGAGAFSFDTISYRTRVLTPGKSIKDIQLTFNGIVPTSDAVASVSELAYAGNPSSPVGAVDVEAPTNLSKTATLSSPQPELTVNKAIIVANGGKITSIDQLYLGTVASVPEPTLFIGNVVTGALFAGYMLMRQGRRGEG